MKVCLDSIKKARNLEIVDLQGNQPSKASILKSGMSKIFETGHNKHFEQFNKEDFLIESSRLKEKQDELKQMLS